MQTLTLSPTLSSASEYAAPLTIPQARAKRTQAPAKRSTATTKARTHDAKAGTSHAFRAARAASNPVAIAAGAFAPIASYLIAHYEAPHYPALCILVAGALIFSAISVYQWGRQEFGGPLKAAGFVVLLEGAMLWTGIMPLSVAALVLLVAINLTQAPRGPKGGK